MVLVLIKDYRFWPRIRRIYLDLQSSKSQLFQHIAGRRGQMSSGTAGVHALTENNVFEFFKTVARHSVALLIWSATPFTILDNITTLLW